MRPGYVMELTDDKVRGHFWRSPAACGSLRAVRRAALVVVACALGGWAARPAQPRALRGWPLYERLCLSCHGALGDGRGPAAPYVWPPPRALTRGELKWRSTPAGRPPSDDDLRTTIRFG